MVLYGILLALPLLSFAQVTFPPITLPRIPLVNPNPQSIPPFQLPTWFEMTGGYDSPSSIFNQMRAYRGIDFRNKNVIDRLKIPGLEAVADSYLDLRNMSKSPLLRPNKYGPAPTGCEAKLEVIIARGIGEIGDYGWLVGDPLMSRVNKTMSGARGYAVQYPAYFGEDSTPTGVKDIVKRLNKQTAACPDQKFALVGYNQGAALFHLAFAEKSDPISPEALKRIVGGAMFADPILGANWLVLLGLPPLQPFPEEIRDRIKQNCIEGDPVCSYGFNIMADLTYNNGTNHIPDSVDHMVKEFKKLVPA